MRTSKRPRSRINRACGGSSERYSSYVGRGRLRSDEEEEEAPASEESAAAAAAYSRRTGRDSNHEFVKKDVEPEGERKVLYVVFVFLGCDSEFFDDDGGSSGVGDDVADDEDEDAEEPAAVEEEEDDAESIPLD